MQIMQFIFNISRISRWWRRWWRQLEPSRWWQEQLICIFDWRCKEVGFICPFVVIDSTNSGATNAVAPGLMLDNFLPIPDAEPLPFYPLVLKLVVCDVVLPVQDANTLLVQREIPVWATQCIHKLYTMCKLYISIDLHGSLRCIWADRWIYPLWIYSLSL